MKRQAIIYFAWDVVFICFLYFYSSVGRWLKLYIGRTMSAASFSLFILPALPMLIGCLIAWMVYISCNYKTTRKSALLEFIMIGIPTFYVATLPVEYYIVSPALKGMYLPIPVWMMEDSIYAIGGIVFGYEIFIFIIRIIRIHHTKNLTNLDDPQGGE